MGNAKKTTMFASLILAAIVAAAMLTAPAMAAGKPGKVENIRAYAGNTSITVKWSKAKGAFGYCIYKKAGTGKFKRIKTTKKRKYTIHDLYGQKKYTFKVRPYINKGRKKVLGKPAVISKTIPKGIIKSWDIGGTGMYNTDTADDSVTAKLYNTGLFSIKGSGGTQYWSESETTPWYKYRYRITSAEMGSGVTPADMSYWFEGFLKVKELPNVPDSVKNMTGTYTDCYSLKTAPAIPEGVTSLRNTFCTCLGLKQAPQLPSTVKDMYGTFAYCRNLKELPKIPEGVTNMDSTFNECSMAVSPVDIPSTVTDITCVYCQCRSLSGAFAIKGNPSVYDCCLLGAAAKENTKVIVNYTSKCIDIDSIIKTQGEGVNVVKGNLAE